MEKELSPSRLFAGQNLTKIDKPQQFLTSSPIPNAQFPIPNAPMPNAQFL
ncbi:MAG: hypothetical protein KME31_29805 [Tolypothrix carrinoi HA7290-LM1]|nr:hypothetical protein [Tolypothrix carrinoi HA7290-LM1]